MKSNLSKLLVCAPCALVLAALLGMGAPGRTAQAQSPSAILENIAEHGKPGPAHAKLQPLVGEWSFAARMWTDPAQSPAEFTGNVSRKWIMGNRFVQETIKGEFDGKPFEGMGLWGYDDAQKKYTTMHACGLAGKIINATCEYNDASRKFQSVSQERCPVTGQLTECREETVLISADRMVMTKFASADGKEVKVMEIVFDRNK
jgi:hypothetical protein